MSDLEVTEPTHLQPNVTTKATHYLCTQHYQYHTLLQSLSFPRHKHTLCLLHLPTHRTILPKKLALPVKQHCSR